MKNKCCFFQALVREQQSFPLGFVRKRAIIPLGFVRKRAIIPLGFVRKDRLFLFISKKMPTFAPA
ncbi:MAG: hypothetical protein IJK87_05010 [Prevotella sp.]|nr:hypothetical protein [Prevotella sp.]